MIKYKVYHGRATFEFNENTIQKITGVCENEKLDFVTVLDQTMTEEVTHFIFRHPWLELTMKEVNRNNTFFEEKDPKEARKKAISYANSLKDVVKDDYYDLMSIHNAIKEHGLQAVLKHANNVLNAYVTAIFLNTDEEEIFIGGFVPTPIENLNRENQILNNYK